LEGGAVCFLNVDTEDGSWGVFGQKEPRLVHVACICTSMRLSPAPDPSIVRIDVPVACPVHVVLQQLYGDEESGSKCSAQDQTVAGSTAVAGMCIPGSTLATDAGGVKQIVLTEDAVYFSHFSLLQLFSLLEEADLPPEIW
jgi:hypothetical protein